MAEKFGERNLRAILNQEAIIEKLNYGVLDIQTEFHNRKITRQTFYGHERKKYGDSKESQQQALSEILKRLTKSTSNKETCKLKFDVEIRNGNIDQVLWKSQLDVVYKD